MHDWTKLSDEDLLKIRIKDLGLEVQKSDVSEKVQNIFDELSEKNLALMPRVYFGDEWFSPEGHCAVAIPFFLAHPRLRELEEKFMLECEGESDAEFSRLLRHEIGHAFDHAFRVSKRSSWIKIFGSPKKIYQPETYRPRPYSKNFVRNVARWYAQAHPDEDFAETFAVWLDPQSNWKTKYKNWGAYKKLLYVDRLAKEFEERDSPPTTGRMISDAKYLESTLGRYYERKRRAFAEDFPDFYDKDLLKIFSSSLDGVSAAKFLKQNRKTIIQTLSEWTGERKSAISEIFNRLTNRCAELKLSLPENQAKVLLDVSAFLATLVSHYLFTGHFGRSGLKRARG